MFKANFYVDGKLVKTQTHKTYISAVRMLDGLVEKRWGDIKREYGATGLLLEGTAIVYRREKWFPVEKKR